MWVSWNRVTTTSPRPARADGASAGASGVAAVVGAAAPCGGGGWPGGDGRVHWASTAAIPMVMRSQAPRARVVRIPAPRNLGPDLVARAAPTPPPPDWFLRWRCPQVKQPVRKRPDARVSDRNVCDHRQHDQRQQVLPPLATGLPGLADQVRTGAKAATRTLQKTTASKG